MTAAGTRFLLLIYKLRAEPGSEAGEMKGVLTGHGDDAGLLGDFVATNCAVGFCHFEIDS